MLGTYGTFVMSDPLTYSPNLLLDFATRLWDFEGFSAKLEISIGWGEASSGDDHDTVSRTPRTISPHLLVACTHHAVLQKQTLLCRGLGFRGVGKLLPHTAGIFVFDVYKMLRFRF